tara:strand:+ start:688 stop:1533 length:846 start_codon:yes stop_codon:yes gene_type:complete
MNKKNDIGFMQGRLSPQINGKIQCFPVEFWRDELELASKNNCCLVEWTLDYEDLYLNPLISKSGQNEIKKLQKLLNIKIESVTGDCFMQQPFWKKEYEKGFNLKKLFLDVVEACEKMNIKYLVVPLVDNGSIENYSQEHNLLSFLLDNEAYFRKINLKIIFESDFKPKQLKKMILKLDDSTFGINYDTGNSAYLGYDSDEEFYEFGDRILNIHIKDRNLKGDTVPLGEGKVNFFKIFKNLKKVNYSGNFILQTARAKDNEHLHAIIKYKKFVDRMVSSYLN